MLHEVLVPSFELRRNFVPFRRVSVFCNLERNVSFARSQQQYTYRLYDAARVVLEDDILDFSADDVHERVEVLRALGFGDVFLTRERPGAFCLGEEGRVRFRRFTLLEQGTLNFVRLTGRFICPNE